MIGVDQFHRGVRSVDDNAAAVDDGPPGIGALDALGADAVLGHQHVRGGVGGLHGGQNPHIDGPLDVVQGQDLEMLDPQAVVLSGVLRQDLFIAVQKLVVGRVADGVAAHLVAVLIGQLHQSIHLVIGIAVVAGMTGPVAVILQHGGGAGTQRAVAEQLDRPHVHVVVVQAALRRGGAQVVGLLALCGGQGHQQIGAQFELSALVQRPVNLVQVLHGGTGVHGRGQAVGEQLLLGHQQGILLLLDSEIGDQAADGVHGGISHAAQQLAAVRLQVFAALGIGGVLGDAGQLKGHGVDPAHMAVCPAQVDRVVGGHCVQVLLGGIVGVLPHGVQPAAALDPLAGLGLLSLRLHGRQDDVLRLPEGVDNQHVLSQAVDVHMALDQAGNDSLAAQIHDLGIRADVSLHTGLVPHIDQAVALDCQCGGNGKLFIYSINFAVAIDTVGGLRPGRHRREHGEKHCESQEHCQNPAETFA